MTRRKRKQPRPRQGGFPSLLSFRSVYWFCQLLFPLSLGISFLSAASPSGPNGASGKLVEVPAPDPPLLGPKKRIAVAASPSRAPPPFPPPVTNTSGTNLALPSASAE